MSAVTATLSYLQTNMQWETKHYPLEFHFKEETGTSYHAEAYREFKNLTADGVLKLAEVRLEIRYIRARPAPEDLTRQSKDQKQ